MSFLWASVSHAELENLITGKALYRLNCSRCHNVDRSAYAPHYPSLKNTKEKFSEEDVIERMENGKGRMPAFPHLSRIEKEAIVSFLFEKGERDAMVSLEDQGNMIYKSHCSSCHPIDHNQRAKFFCPRQPPPLTTISRRVTKDRFFQTLGTGIRYMPSFAHFNKSEREAIYSFVKSLNRQKGPRNRTRGGICPGMMRRGRR